LQSKEAALLEGGFVISVEKFENIVEKSGMFFVSEKTIVNSPR
jgi:hypothetical protein